MLDNKEISYIKKKFENYIKNEKIIAPKKYRAVFFKEKAFSSLRLAEFLREQNDFFDWAVNASYYSMFYNATSLLAYINVDLSDISESIHVLTYQALAYFFHITKKTIAKQYIEDFKDSMEESDVRLMNIALKKTEEILSSFKNARVERGMITYQLGKSAELRNVDTAIRRACNFDILAEKLSLNFK